MLGDHAKREIVSSDKPRELGEDSLKGVRRQAQGGILFLHQVPSKRRQEKEDEESGILWDWLIIALHIKLRFVSRSKRHERKKYNKMPLRYPCISKHAPLLSVPLGKPPYFDGEDYCMWSDKMRHHLTSLHKSIWDIVDYGAQIPKVGDKDYDSDEVDQIRHFNSQATTILLTSLCREEYNKVQGLKTAKEIWDILKTAHEGDEVTKITKRETIEGELG
jgi:hypothetical protein